MEQLLRDSDCIRVLSVTTLDTSPLQISCTSLGCVRNLVKLGHLPGEIILQLMRRGLLPRILYLVFPKPLVPRDWKRYPWMPRNSVALSQLYDRRPREVWPPRVLQIAVSPHEAHQLDPGRLENSLGQPR